ncbi:hypothetical protein [Streptomyces nodosus]|uniref:hypothetical protein n=1 Tax=Streptomyces nodosus TaxID=40318 RepID=UPI000A83BFFB|nr:hypothetical protein [Streptomyces nodosus]MBB4795828.1 hypothetical protein [Streptomyces nodosus]
MHGRGPRPLRRQVGASLGLEPLPMSYFPWLIGTLLAYCTLTQLVKTWFVRRCGTWL